MSISQTAAIVLAAGLSSRMGQPKMLLPWGARTVLAQVVHTLQQAAVPQIVVVTGGQHAAIASALHDTPARVVFNPSFENDSMLTSLQVGLRALTPNAHMALVTLGDQPQMQAATVTAVIAGWQVTRAPVVAPSFQMRRGHPWALDASLWGAALTLEPPRTLRDLFSLAGNRIHYVLVDTPTIFQDLDTPEDYARAARASD
ncbi:MAG: nucleotidyltransferase family protein [Anaerolineales bacterium]